MSAESSVSRLREWLRSWTNPRKIWPPIDYELAEHKARGRLNGLVLNAGSGWRDITHLIEGELINQDITWPGDTRTNVHIISPLHRIPRPNDTFDTIVCIGVLEHVENPEEIVPELHRVLKPGGWIIASVPFMQPEHKVPTDFQRYTKDGLTRLFAHHGFEVQQVKTLFTVYHTIYWIIYEWLRLKPHLGYKLLRYTLLPPLAWLALNSDLKSDVLASGFQLLGTKPNRP